MTTAQLIDFISEPTIWLYGGIAVVILVLMFGRQNKHDEVDKMIADYHNVTLPPGGEKGVGLVDAPNILSFFGFGGALMAGLMLNPAFFGLAAVMFVILIGTLLRVWVTSQNRLRRAGMTANESPGIAGCFIMIFVLMAIGTVVIVFLAMGLLV